MTHRRYNAVLLAVIGPVIALLAVTSLFLEPYDGGLTRLGGYSEELYGWNETQLRFPKTLYKQFMTRALPTESLSTSMPSPSVPSSPTGMIEVAFVIDGNLQVWDEATQQTRTIVNTGDVFSVTVSEDGQIIAYTRGSWVGDVFEGYEQFALWAINRDGGNPRELISAQDLRQRINPGERESSNFFQLGWVLQ